MRRQLPRPRALLPTTAKRATIAQAGLPMLDSYPVRKTLRVRQELILHPLARQELSQPPCALRPAPLATQGSLVMGRARSKCAEAASGASTMSSRNACLASITAH